MKDKETINRAFGANITLIGEHGIVSSSYRTKNGVRKGITDTQ